MDLRNFNSEKTSPCKSSISVSEFVLKQPNTKTQHKPFIAAMEDLLGLLRIRVKRGINLVVRDTVSSDPYVVITMGHQVCLIRSRSICIHTHICIYILAMNANAMRVHENWGADQRGEI